MVTLITNNNKLINAITQQNLNLVIDYLSYPVEVVRHPGVYTGYPRLSAADSPGNYTGQLPSALTLANHGTAAVTLACVLALLASRANEARVKVEARSQTSATHLVLAHGVAYDRHVHLLQDVLVLAEVPEGVLAPAGGPAPAESSSSRQLRVKIFLKTVDE